MEKSVQPTPEVNSNLEENKRKRKLSKKAEEHKAEKKKKISSEESEIILDAYNYHKGDGRLIMEDPKITVLNRERVHLQNHVDYKRKKKNKTISPNKGNSKRTEIVEEIEDEIDKFTTVEEAIDKYESKEVPEVTNETISLSTPPLSPNSQLLHEVDKESLSDSVSSEDIERLGAKNHMNLVKSRTTLRNQKIQKKEIEKKTLIKEVRDQKNEKKESNDYKMMMMSMMIQNQQQFQQQQLQFQLQQQQYQQQQQQFQQQQANISNMIMMKLLDKKDEKEKEQ